MDINDIVNFKEVKDFFDYDNELIVLTKAPKFITPLHLSKISKYIKTLPIGTHIQYRRFIKLMSIEHNGQQVKYCHVSFFNADEIELVQYYIVKKVDLLKFYKITKHYRNIFKKDTTRFSNQNLIFDEYLENKIHNCTSGILNNQKILQDYNVRMNIGIILRGNPGNGKTSLVTKIVSQLKNVMFKFFDSTSPISDVSKFRKACIANGQNNVIIFDDVDINLFSRGKSRDSNDFLSILDGPEDKGSQKCISITIFTTNESLDSMDSAFLRPGRIDHVFEIKNPTLKQREFFLSTFHANILDFLQKNGEDAQTVGLATEDFSFAMLEGFKSQVVNRMLFSPDKALDTFSIINEIKSTFKNRKSKLGL